MKMWQGVCLIIMFLIVVLLLVLVRNLRQIAKKIQEEADEYEGYEYTEEEKQLENHRIFIGDMAHEMKTPLTAILAFAEILSAKQDITEKECREYSGYICTEARRLRDMSQKLLMLVQFQGERDNAKKEDVFLADLIKEVLNIERLLCASRQIEIRADLCECVVNGDADLLKSLIYNLIDNAKKAIGQNGKILIHTEKDEKNVKIQIIDSGKGIPKEKIEYITKPFYVMDKMASEKENGAGHGLSLCQRIIQFHDGKLTIESQIGKRSTFTVWLPARKPNI